MRRAKVLHEVVKVKLLIRVCEFAARRGDTPDLPYAKISGQVALADDRQLVDDLGAEVNDGVNHQ